MSGAFLRRRDQTVRPLRVDHYSAAVNMQLLFGASIPHDVLLSLPYLATILGVWISGRMRGGAKAATEALELRDY